MASRYLLVFMSLFISGILFSDTIPENPDASTSFFKTHKQSPSAEELKDSFDQSSKINLWKYFWRILFIFILLVGVIFAISKYTNGSSLILNNSYENNHFKILFQQFLSSKQKIILVKSFNKYLLLGISDQSINVLTEFNENEIDEENLIETKPQTFFNTILGKYIQNGK